MTIGVFEWWSVPARRGAQSLFAPDRLYSVSAFERITLCMGCNHSQHVYQPSTAGQQKDQIPDPDNATSKSSTASSKCSIKDDDCGVVDGGAAQKAWPSHLTNDVDDDEEALVLQTRESQELNTSVTSGLGAHGASVSSHQSTVAFPLHQHRRSSLEIDATDITAVTQVEVRRPSILSAGPSPGKSGEHAAGVPRSSSIAHSLYNSAAGGRHRARSFARHSSPRLSIPTNTVPPPRHRSRSCSFSSAGHAVDDIRLTRSIEGWGRSALIVDPIGSTTALIADTMALTGYVCEVAQNCDEALDMATTRSYFMILLDSSLTGDTAMNISRLIRSSENSKRKEKTSCLILCILDTNYSCEDLSDLISAGMDGCIRKNPTLSQGIHEALALKDAHPNLFAVLDDSFQSKESADSHNEVSPESICVEFEDGATRNDFCAPSMAFERNVNSEKKRSGHKVLLVQESETSQPSICRSLVSCGYGLHTVRSSKDALHKAAENEYDLILLETQESALSQTATFCEELRVAHLSANPHRLPFILFGLGNMSTNAHDSLANVGVNGCLAPNSGNYGIFEALALFRVNPSDYVRTNEHGTLQINAKNELENKNPLSWRRSAP